MFCAASQKLLHRRSQKKLRDSETTPTHKRQNSAWSDSSSSGSESSRRDGSTVEWDPLRLHPAMAAAASPEEQSPRCVERRYQHQEEAEEKHLRAHRQHSYQHFRQHRPAHSQPGFSLEIYDGFDFGFGAPLPGMTQSGGGGARPLRAPRSESDLRHHQRHSSPEPAEWGESQPPSPSRRPLPASLNEADYFLKRGGWKRRGIVFASDEPTATDDDVFEIP